MGVMYCEYCHRYIDEDWDAEHFYVENERYGCVKEEEDKAGEDECPKL